MKKRVLVALLATALTVSMMTGCGSKKTEDTSSGQRQKKHPKTAIRRQQTKWQS